jgi:hypothetical protein
LHGGDGAVYWQQAAYSWPEDPLLSNSPRKENMNFVFSPEQSKPNQRLARFILHGGAGAIYRR